MDTGLPTRRMRRAGAPNARGGCSRSRGWTGFCTPCRRAPPFSISAAARESRSPVTGQGCAVTGVDFSPAMLAIARVRLPEARWIEADMRSMELGKRFDAIVAWDSFFHLAADEQRALIPRLSRHLAPGGAILLTVGPEAGETLGRVGDAVVYHASLSRAEYAELLAHAEMEVAAFVADDPDCAGHSVLLACRRDG